MKKMLLAAAVLTVGFASACGSPCDVLSDHCDKCTNASLKTSCQQAAATYKAVPISGNTACQQLLDSGAYDSCK